MKTVAVYDILPTGCRELHRRPIAALPLHHLPSGSLPRRRHARRRPGLHRQPLQDARRRPLLAQARRAYQRRRLAHARRPRAGRRHHPGGSASPSIRVKARSKKPATSSSPSRKGCSAPSTSPTRSASCWPGSSPGARPPGQITLYKSVGIAVQDVAAARLVYERAVALGVGVEVEL